MTRIYLLGIISVLLFLNIPTVRGDTQQRVSIQRVRIERQITIWQDKYTPAIQSLIEQVKTNPNVSVDNGDNWSLYHGASLTANQTDEILHDYGSPAAGIGNYLLTLSNKYTIDNAYALFIFIRESTAGTNTAWLEGNTHNPGNIRCYGNMTCYNGFVKYPSWEAGFEDLYKLLVSYRDQDKIDTIDNAMRKWAPPSENDTEGYIAALHENVSTWRAVNINAVRIAATTFNSGKLVEVSPGMKINANFYDVSCAAWGNQPGCMHYGTDIAVDKNKPVYAPVDGIYIITDHYYDSQRLGDYVMYNTSDGCELYSGHLKNAVKKVAGEKINAGDILGYGNEAVVGPHTHIQLRCKGELVDFMKYYNERKK